MLTNLSLVLRDRYLRTGDPKDLVEAIRTCERACRESDSLAAE